MNIFDLVIYAVLLGVAAFAFFLIGPFLSGALLLLLVVVVLANLISPR